MFRKKILSHLVHKFMLASVFLALPFMAFANQKYNGLDALKNKYNSGAKGVVAVRDAANVISVSWDAPKNNPFIKEYRVLMALDSMHWKRIKVVPGDKREVILKNMPTQTLDLQVRAVMRYRVKQGSDFREKEMRLPLSQMVTVASLIDNAPIYEDGGEVMPEIYSVLDAKTSGVTVNEFHVDFIHAMNDYVEWSFEIKKSGLYNIGFNYSLSRGLRPMRLTVDGQDQPKPIKFLSTRSWTIWRNKSVALDLSRGQHTVRLTSIGSNGPHLRNMRVEKMGLKMVYQAEDADLKGSKVDKFFVDMILKSNAYIEWNVMIPRDGLYDFKFKYALAKGNRPLVFLINDEEFSKTVEFPETGSWKRWKLAIKSGVQLRKGLHRVKIKALGRSGANIDYMVVAPYSADATVLKY